MVVCVCKTQHCDEFREGCRISLFAQPTSEQLKEIILYKEKTETCATDAQAWVDNGEEVLDPGNTSFEWNSFLNTRNNTSDHVSCWDCQATKSPSDSPFESWLDPWQQVFNTRLNQNLVSGELSVGDMVYCEEIGLGVRYTRSSSGRRNGSWHDFYLSGSRHERQIADWEGCFEVATVNFVGEYSWRVSQYGAEQLSWDDQWRFRVVSSAETEFSTLLALGDPDHSTSGVSSTYCSPGTNPGNHNVRSGSDIP